MNKSDLGYIFFALFAFFLTILILIYVYKYESNATGKETDMIILISFTVVFFVLSVLSFYMKKRKNKNRY